MKIVKLAILMFWLLMLGLLLHKHYYDTPSERISFASVQDTVEYKESWMGIYLHGKKVGYALSSTKRVGDTYQIIQRSLMYLTLGGTRHRVDAYLNASVDLAFALKAFTFSLSSAGVKYSLLGSVEEGNALKLIITSGQHQSEQTMHLPQSPFLANTARPFLFSQPVEVGGRYRLPFFDPSTLTNSDVIIDVQGIEELVYRGAPVATYRIRESFKGLHATAWVTTDGVTIREESPLGLTLVREDEEAALAGTWTKGSAEDLMLASAVPVAKCISDARTIKHLIVKLENVSLDEFDIGGGRQVLRGNVLQIHKEVPDEWQTFSLPYNREDLEAYLEPSPLIQSDHPRIIKQAREATTLNTDAEESARMLLTWVHQYLDKRSTVSVPSALEVLDVKAGDCNEHAALFTALCRARGIPTRICAGLVYLDGRFFYHAWAEIFLGNWVAVDPAFNQFPADATHIRLVIGDLADQLKLLKLVGSIRLTVVEYS